MIMPINRRSQTVLEYLSKVRLFAQIPDFLLIFVRQVGIKYFVTPSHCVCLNQHIENGESVFDIHQEIESVHVYSYHLDFVSWLTRIYIVP
jgi:hypothetical protein